MKVCIIGTALCLLAAILPVDTRASVMLDWDVQSLGIIEDGGSVCVWNGQVAWRQGITGLYQHIYLWDGTSVSQIASDVTILGTDLYDGMIVYSHDGEIVLWDGENHIQITDNDVDDTAPSIWGDEIAWNRGFNYTREIWYWSAEDGVEVRITDNSYPDGGPQVSEGTIAWSIWDGTQCDIGWWDGGSDTRITNDADEDWLCSNYLGTVVYSRLVDGQYDLFLWDGTQTIQLTDTPDISEIYPSLFDGFVAFHAYDGHDAEIFLWYNGEVYQVTDNDYDDFFPDLWVSDDYIQIAWEGEGTQVMYAVCDNPFTVPEPSTLLLALSGLLLFRLRSRLRAA